MKRASLAAVAPIILALLSGCGSAGKGTSAASPSKGAYAAAASSSTPSTAAIAPITTKQNKLGTILALGSKSLTVYLFEGDRGRASSSCTGACASVWPPVTGRPQASGQALASALGTTTRPDGTTQVTYKGHPLYLYSQDKDQSDAYGQAIKSFGADWYVIAPSGSKVDHS